MRSTVVIRKQGDRYYATVQGKFGGGYSNARAGLSPHDAAAFAAMAMIEYAVENPEGGDLMAPAEVLELVPEHLRKISTKAGVPGNR